MAFSVNFHMIKFTFSTSARTIPVNNCLKLPGNLILLPVGAWPDGFEALNRLKWPRYYSNFRFLKVLLIEDDLIYLFVNSVSQTRELFRPNQFIECWEYCCSSSFCYYSIKFLPHPRVRFVCLWLVWTPNASLSHSRPTVGPHATYWLPPANCHLPTAPCQLSTANCRK